MAGCPRYLYFYIRPGCFPPQPPAVSSSRQAACLVRPPPSRKGMETVSTLGQGAESSWATPKGRYAWSGGVTEEAAGRDGVAGQDRTGGRRLLRGRWVGKMAGCPSGWQIDPTGRTAWFGLAGRITGPWTQRNVAVCLVGLPPLFVPFSTGRPAMGIRHHQHTPPRSPGSGPMPTLPPATLQRSAKMELQGREGTDGETANMAEAGQQEAGHSAPSPACAKPVCSTATGHSTPGPGSTAAGGPQHGQEGHSRGFDSDQPELAAQQCFFLPRTNQRRHPRAPPTPFRNLPWKLATSPARPALSHLCAAGCWPVSQCSFGECIRDHERLVTQGRMDRESPPRHSTEVPHGVYPEPNTGQLRTPGDKVRSARARKSNLGIFRGVADLLFSTPTSPAAGNLASETETKAE